MAHLVLKGGRGDGRQAHLPPLRTQVSEWSGHPFGSASLPFPAAACSPAWQCAALAGKRLRCAGSPDFPGTCSGPAGGHRRLHHLSEQTANRSNDCWAPVDIVLSHILGKMGLSEDDSDSYHIFLGDKIYYHCERALSYASHSSIKEKQRLIIYPSGQEAVICMLQLTDFVSNLIYAERKRTKIASLSFSHRSL